MAESIYMYWGDVSVLFSAVSRTFSDASISCQTLHCLYSYLQVAEYKAAQEAAKRSHANMWMYGDITEDDAKEFGLGR